MTRPTGVANPEGFPIIYTCNLGDNDFQRGHAYYFPILIRIGGEDGNGKNNHQQSVFEEIAAYHVARANLSDKSREYLQLLGIKNLDADAETAGLIWMHALAIGYSPAYLEENADGIRQDWPRIPLPAKQRALLDSAALGRRVAALLDTEQPVEGTTCGQLDPRLKPLGTIRKAGGGALDPDTGELDVTAGWGHAGKNGVCMPGRGKYEERRIKDEGQKACFGDGTLDIYLNGAAYWKNVPRAVWDYTIGGYQVLKKWLSYREKAMLGRGLTMEEAEYITEMVRRIAALILLRPELDKNYGTVKAGAWPWPKG